MIEPHEGMYMAPDDQMQSLRTAYASRVMADAGVNDARLARAFATVPRESFLGPGPWKRVRSLSEYVLTPDADPAHLYVNELIGIIPEKQINNGLPSFHAGLMSQAAVAEGEHVVHIGAGVGYYTAIFAELVGKDGSVTAIEYLPELAARARSNLQSYSNVEVVQGDGSKMHFRPADVIYVNAGATRPADPWLDQLADGGRLILPLTTEKACSETFDKITSGAVFRIERRGEDFLATWIATVSVFPCAGGRDEVSELALAASLAKGGEHKVTRLYRTQFPSEERCWLRAPGWCLAFD
jgi:protein-L-isoaspartate(D-aspartate) O-methyltransferase